MSFSLNEIRLLGGIGQDAEFKTTNSNIEIAKFSVATSESYKDKSDVWQENTTWHNIILWKPSEFIKGKLVKGARVLILGRQENRVWEDEGTKKYFSEVVANKIIPLDRDSQSTNQESKPKSDMSVPSDNESDDDLPF